MPLPEFIDNFFTTVGEKWEDFLDWSDEKGLPLRKASDFLESHGIPPLPFFVIVILALIVGVFILIVSLTAPQIGVFTVIAQSPSSQPVQGATVSISYPSVNGTILSFSSVTDSNGMASFNNIPLGVNVSVTVSSSNYEPVTSQASFTSNGTMVTVPLVPIATSTVKLPVVVQGPSQANLTLFINGTQVETELASPSYTFNLQPGVNYSLTASAPGWRGYQTYIELAQDSSPLTIKMFQFGQPVTAPVSAIIEQDTPPYTPITNANVNVIESSTNKVLGTLTTNGSSDGSTNQLQVIVGDSIYLSASAPGYLSRTSSTYNVTENGVNPTIYLDALNTQNSQNIAVNVVDVNGNNIQTPLVSVYCNGVLFAQDTPANGVDSFNVPIGTTCLVTAFSQGYLPASKLVTSAGVGTIILQNANSHNSGSLSVETIQGNNPVAGVSVSLSNSINQPLGIPSQNTGPDGFTTFQEVPLGNIQIQASGQGFTGNASALITNSPNLTTIIIQLTPAPALVNITAVDFVTGNPINIFNASSSGASCATTAGSCILKLPSGVDTITLTSPNYQNLSSTITLSAGVQLNQSFTLIPNAFSQNLQLEFLGLYNNGFKVNSLSPNTNYEARFILNAPTINFSTATVYVQIGGSEDISASPAYISSFSGNPSTGSSLNSNNTESQLKWVLYNVTPFTGSQEFDVFIQTKAVKNASLILQWSDSYTFGNSTFNSPPSGLNSQSIPITFEGDCVNGACVQLYFSGVLGNGLNNFQALTPETFKLNYNILSNTSKPVLVQTNSSGLQLVQAVENTQTIQAQDNTLNFNSNGSGFILIKALHPVNNGLITFNTATYSKQLYVKVIASNYNLNVNYAPTNIKALTENHLKFTVTDSNGMPLTTATIQLTGVLDNPVQAVYSNGFYTADITPNAPGVIYFTVSTPGYKTYSGSINVGVDKIISVTPQTLALTVNSLNFSTVDFQVQNLLNENTLITFQTITFNPKYTVVSTTSTSTTLKSLASFTNSLQAAVSNTVQQAALQANTLNENVKGYVNIIARSGGYTQTIQLPFNIQTSFTQTNIQQAVSLSASALQFQIILPMQPTSSQNEVITNNAPFPVLVNAQTSSGEFQVTPLSAVIPSGESQTFTVTAYLPWAYQQLQCVISQAPDTGVASFYASAQGVSSQALPVTLTSTIQNYGTCQIPGGLIVKLPFPAIFIFANGSAVIGQQSQQDGSTPVLIPQGLMIFQYGSGVQQSFVSLPAGVGVEVPPNWVSTSTTETTVTFPTPILISTGTAKTITNADGSVSLTTDSGTLILPPGSQLQANQQLNYNPFIGIPYTPFSTQLSASSTQLANPYASLYNPGLINPYAFGPIVQPFNYIQNGYLVPPGGVIKFTPTSNLLHTLTFDYSAYGKVLVSGVSENQGSVVPTNGGFDITFPKCSQIKVFNAQPNPALKLSDTLPAAKQVTLSNAAQTANGFEVQGQIQIKACTDVDETQKYFTTVLQTPLYFNLPSITRTSAGNYDLGGCDKLNITGGSLPIMQATKIIFQNNYQEQKDENGNWIVSVDRLGVVSILPCGVEGVIKINPPDNNVYITFNNKAVSPVNPVNFTLTSSQKSQTQQIVLNNYADTPLDPNGRVDSEGVTTYIQNIDSNISKFFTIDSLHSSNAPLMRRIDRASYTNILNLDATDTSPQACLPDQTLTGKITIALKGNNEIIKTIYVTVNTKSDGCPSNNLGNALTNFSISPDKIYFKNPGPQYYTFASFINNLRQPVKIIMLNPDVIKCAITQPVQTLPLPGGERLPTGDLNGSVIPSGYGIVANCTGLKNANNQPVYFNAVNPETNQVLATANLTVTVFTVPQNEQDFYTSTPIGSLAPLGVPASFTTCENQFCNYNQTAQALLDFFNNTTNFLNQSLPNPQSLSSFCSQNLYLQKGRPLTTSAVFLMANTQSKLDDILPSLSGVVQQYGFNPQAYKSGGTDLTGCGLFEVTAKYFLCPPQGGAEWKQSAKIEVDVQKLASCPQTIADAPLFLMADNTTDAWIGRTTSNIVRDVSVHASLPPVFLGPYDNYPTNSNLQGGNSLDEETAKSLLDAFYYSSKPSLSFNVAQRYDDASFCTTNAAGLGAAIAAATVGGALVTSGLDVLLTPLALAVGSCGASAVTTMFPGVTGCEAANTCIRTEISSAILPFIKYCGLTGTAAPTFEAALGAAGVSAATGVIPAVIGAATMGSNNYQSLSGTSTGASIGAASSILPYSKSNAINTIKQLILANQDKRIQAESVEGQPTGVEIKMSPLLDVLNEKYPGSSSQEIAEKIYSDVKNNQEITLDSSLNAKFAYAAGNTKFAEDISGLSPDQLSSAVKADLSEAGGVKTFINKIPGGLKNFGLCVALQAGVQYLIGVDMSPVQANLNPKASNHLIVYNLEYYRTGKNLPSIYTVNLNGNSFYLGNFCNSSNSLCLREWNVSENQYVLIVGVNNQGLNLNNIFQSVFLPSVPPVGGLEKVVSSVVTTKNMGVLNDSSDEGDQTGFGSSAVQSNTGVISG